MKSSIAYVEVYVDYINGDIATVNSEVEWGGGHYHFDIPSDYLINGKFIKVVRYGEDTFQFGGEGLTIDKDRIYDEIPNEN